MYVQCWGHICSPPSSSDEYLANTSLWSVPMIVAGTALKLASLAYYVAIATGLHRVLHMSE
ncbi:hypothetical protein BC828DRAFT_379737 [Blastocladiella britannica]|nr:hypothetical protein BC828DRAFT_379737 [Blastocladiella britannica]